MVDLGREADEARLDRGLSYEAVGRALDLSGEQVARICRGESPEVSLRRFAELLEVVGLELAARAYPGSTPVRDRAQQALLERLHARLPSSLEWRLEEPVIGLAGSADSRAWDASVRGAGWKIGVEAETRVRDWQAVQRRIALKQRDGDVDAVLLLLLEGRWHRDLMRGAIVRTAMFPVPGRTALQRLTNGHAPAGNAIVLL